MDEDNFEKSHDASRANHDPLAELTDTGTHDHVAYAETLRRRFVDLTGRTAQGSDVSRTPGITWVRASDLLSNGTGRVAGRGLNFESELTRRMRQGPGVTRRAVRERAHRLPPLSEFGRSREYPPFSRQGLGR